MTLEPTVRCPKCGTEQTPAEQCARCGIFFRRYRERPAAAAATRPAARPEGLRGLRGGKLVAVVVGLTLVLGLGSTTAFFALLFHVLKRSEPYERSATLIRESDAVRNLVGEDLQLGYFIQGSVVGTGAGGEAEFLIPVSGRSGATKVYLSWEKEQGEWRLKAAQYEDATGRARSLGAARSPTEGARAAQSHVLLGYELYQKGKYREALEKYDEAIALDAQSAEAYFYRGLAADRIGDRARALADVQSSIQLDPRRLDSYQRVLPASMRDLTRWHE